MPRYTVTGPHPVLDHDPGETFTADIPAAQEEFLVEHGHLAVAGDSLSKLPRGELDALASERGIDPAAHPNKTSLIDAIKAHDDQAASGQED